MSSAKSCAFHSLLSLFFTWLFLLDLLDLARDHFAPMRRRAMDPDAEHFRRQFAVNFKQRANFPPEISTRGNCSELSVRELPHLFPATNTCIARASSRNNIKRRGKVSRSSLHIRAFAIKFPGSLSLQCTFNFPGIEFPCPLSLSLSLSASITEAPFSGGSGWPRPTLGRSFGRIRRRALHQEFARSLARRD